jgi:Prolyl oligopeptidase, N-terminal beta-propeller domain
LRFTSTDSGLKTLIVQIGCGERFLAVDLTGARRHHLFLRPDQSPISASRMPVLISRFRPMGQTLFYIKLEQTNLRASQVWRRNLATSSDVLVYSEPDPRAEVSVAQSKSRQFILIKSEREDLTEIRYAPAQNHRRPPRRDPLLCRSCERPFLRPDESRRAGLPLDDSARRSSG